MEDKHIKKSHALRPKAQGLYNPLKEHDGCGIGFVANIDGSRSFNTIEDGLEMVENLTHRGAVGADASVGDGAGILTHIPDNLFREELKNQNIILPSKGEYGVGMIFLPSDPNVSEKCISVVEEIISKNNLQIIGWRNVPINKKVLSSYMKKSAPYIKQIFVKGIFRNNVKNNFERKLFVIRKQISNSIREKSLKNRKLEQFYICSFSCKTIVYKGMLLSNLLRLFYNDLQDNRFESAFALIHQRFSTNTFPSWDLAQPFRSICHNGEINTLRGNVNWMAARRSMMESKLFGKDISKIWPLIVMGQSDSACFDNALELLIMGGYSLSQAMMLLIPEAWQENRQMNIEKKAFYEYSSVFMEPWDGPAAVAFTDGEQIGATLDRNGLRPARYFITNDNKIILSSEMGVLNVPEENIIVKSRLKPGKMLLVDMDKGLIINDEKTKNNIIKKENYKNLIKKTRIRIENLKKYKITSNINNKNSKYYLQRTFGYTQEDIKFLMAPMILNSAEGIGSMGTDTPIAVLSKRPKLLYNYFKQNFAQVTNPAIDPIREELVMSLKTFLGSRPNLLKLDKDEEFRIKLESPILTNQEINNLKHLNKPYDKFFRVKIIEATIPIKDKKSCFVKLIKSLCLQSEKAVKDEKCNIIIISDTSTSKDCIPIPAVLSLSAVHQYLVKKGLRTKCSLISETGEAREVHHFCVLGGFGAEAINPYLALDTLTDVEKHAKTKLKPSQIEENYIKAIGKGILKVMSKMGISTYQSYIGAQIFDAIGLNSSFVDDYFTGTATTIEGLGLKEILNESFYRHQCSYKNKLEKTDLLDVGGEYAYRLGGEKHVWNPDTIANLQHSVRAQDLNKYRVYSKRINEDNVDLMNTRSLFKIKKIKNPIPITKVEEAKEIVKRFSTGAMSFGSISREAHTTLAIAMNRLKGRSNTGEGGEERDRYKVLANGDSMRSAIKQVASGRFGVTTEYLVNSTDIQIKIAQGAKPGEGGQLPGHKVDKIIASVRYSTPGVGLISPPPHHDIYSIEDIAQLIFDLKNVNPKARISVKLVSEVGVGTVAAGVVKAKADHITIAGFEGGTGASPLTSIKHAGSPWEIGLAETQQTLVMNDLRGRVSLQVDGGFRTGRDVVIGALLGADEFGFSTAPLITLGCIMMRKCHLNTCPVGIATQDPILRKRFNGKPEHVIRYFFFIAEEVRVLMSEMGFRRFNDIIGRADKLVGLKEKNNNKIEGLDFKRLFYRPKFKKNVSIYNTEKQDHMLIDVLDQKLIRSVKEAVLSRKNITLETRIKNTDRTTGAMLSGFIAEKYGHDGLKDDFIVVRMQGTAGQSFGAFTSKGVTFELCGEANDYVGKGLSGGKIIIYPAVNSKIIPEESIIIGNTVLYGAVAGECYFRGEAGERFAVRNSGAWAVVEGLGDHGCEYMTGGVVICIGNTGRNFAAGMSGGLAYVYDDKDDFKDRCNSSLVELESIRDEKLMGDENMDINLVSEDMLSHHADRINIMVRRHFRYTNSKKALSILKNWKVSLSKFKLVLPTDYKLALENMRN